MGGHADNDRADAEFAYFESLESAPSCLEAISNFWKARVADVDSAASQLATLARSEDTDVVVNAFFSLPIEYTVLPEHHGLTYQDVFDAGLVEVTRLCAEASTSRIAVEDAMQSPFKL